jgi:hypothetical protein
MIESLRGWTAAVRASWDAVEMPIFVDSLYGIIVVELGLQKCKNMGVFWNPASH